LTGNDSHPQGVALVAILNLSKVGVEGSNQVVKTVLRARFCLHDRYHSEV